MTHSRWVLSLVFTVVLYTSSYGQFRVGVAKQVITPDPLLPVSGGMGPSAPAKEKRGELTARAMVFAAGETRVAICSVDLLGFPAVLGNRARALIKGIPPEHVLIAASHTHSAPDCYAFPDGQGGHTGDLGYMDSVCQRIAEAVNHANRNLAPAELKIAAGKTEGKIAYNYYAPDLYDPTASVLQALRPDGRVIGTLVNYAIHPEVLGAGQGILSPDLVGPLCDRVEEIVGGMAMFVNGAQGGMVTADNRDLEKLPRDPRRGYWDDKRTWQECLRIGHTLADESVRIVDPAPRQPNPGLAIVSRNVRFPVPSDDLWVVVKHSPLKYPHNDDRTITTQVNLVSIGDAQILTIPGEALPNIGLFLKRKMPANHKFLFGLTNDAFGYILTQVDFSSFERYEYISRVSLGEMTGEIYMKNALELIQAAQSDR